MRKGGASDDLALRAREVGYVAFTGLSSLSSSASKKATYIHSLERELECFGTSEQELPRHIVGGRSLRREVRVAL